MLSLDAKKIHEQLQHPNVWQHLEVFTCINSTQHYLLQKIKETPNQNRICFAEQQTAGIGRLGRSWYSAPHSSLLFSLSWYFPQTPSNINRLSIISTLAIIKAFKQAHIHANFQIKWPNDILWEKQKCVGILLDIQQHANSCHLVIGVGINLQLPSSAPINQAFTDLYTITGRTIHREQLAIALINQFTQVLTEIENPLLWENTFNAFKQYDALFGKCIQIQIGKDKHEGFACGIGPQGELQIQSHNTLQTFFAGDITKIHW